MSYQATAVLLATLCVIRGSAILDPSIGTEPTPASPAAETPLGLWAWSAEPSAASHSLSVERDDATWLVRLDGESVAATHDRGVLTIPGPDGTSFVGKLAVDESEIRGNWYQLPSNLGYQFVATPAVLPRVESGAWQADITIQPRPFHVFLDVFEGENDDVQAVIRNPERNNTLRANRFQVLPAGDDWNLVSGTGEDERRYELKAAEGGGLLLEYELEGDWLLLHPATDTTGYAPRLAGDVPTAASPIQLDDGWSVATPDEAGFDAGALQKLTTELANVDPRNPRPQMVHSVLAARGGKLFYEEYFFGHDREMRHDVRSLGKVFGSIMVGALQQQGHAINADHRPVADVLKRAGLPLDDPRKEDILLAHLLTFTSGLDCSASGDSAGAEWRMWEQQEQPDYWVFTSQLSMLHDPGMRYAYCSGSANLVGASLRAFGGAPVHELFDNLIAQPLGFGPYHFALSPNGEGYLGGGAYVRPRDILKLGAMYLAGGEWNGEQVIDEDWVEESQTPMIAISTETTGLSRSDFANDYVGGAQAYIWRVDTVTAGAETYDTFEASGNGGQLLIVVPELDLTVGFTGGNYRQGGIWNRWRNEIVGGHIIPAMRND